MISKRPQRGVTFTELIIATAVVGIIMIGVVSSDYAIRKQSDSAFNSNLSGLNAQGMLTHVLNSAQLATGMNIDKGILIGAAGVGDAGSFCVRTVFSPANWVCYTSSAGRLYTCTKAAIVAGVQCSAATTNLGAINGTVTPTFTLSNTAGSQQLIFTVTLTVNDSSVAGGTRSVTGSITPKLHVI